MRLANVIARNIRDITGLRASPRPACVRHVRRSPSARRAFTMVELLLVLVIVGALAALALPNLRRAVELARITRAIGDLRALSQDIAEYHLNNRAYPINLAAIGRSGFRDPWGNPYRYLVIATASQGEVRKDRFLVPVNSDFDLYSMGADGASQPPFTAGPSRDDIVRANDGGFVGLAEDF